LKLETKRQPLKDLSNLIQKKKRNFNANEGQTEFSDIFIPNTVKDVHFHVHWH
jgi:hypothetical protein